MKPLQFISVRLSICLIVGILLSRFLHPSTTAAFFLVIFGIVALGFLFAKSGKKSISFGVTALITSLFIGMLSFSLSQPKNNSKHYSHQSTSDAIVWKLKVNEVLKPNSFSDRYITRVIAMGDQKVTGTILFSLLSNSTTLNLKVDDEFLVYAIPEAMNKPLNPHQFNYASYMEELGVYHQIQSASNTISVSSSSSKTLKGVAASARDNIIQKLEKSNFGEEELSIIKALLLGQRNDIETETLTAYKNAGALHILALSGLHIGILLLLLEFLLKPLELLPHGRKVKLATILLLLWSFAFLAGMSPSLIRAVSMFTFVAYALFLNRPTSTFNILSLSLFFILLFQPQLLFSVGFQMSYAAVFSIVLFYPMLQKLVQSKFWLPNKIWQLFSISIAAQLGVLPISLFYFHQFPSLFFISNLIVVPFLGIILGIGILVILLSLFNILPNFLSDVYNSIIGLMNTCIKWVSNQEAFLFEGISFDRVQLVLGYLSLIIFLLFLSKKSFKRAAFFLGCIICFQGCTIYKSYELSKKESLLVLHKSRNTILLHRTGNKLNVLASNQKNINSVVTDYAIAEKISSVTHRPVKNSYRFKNSSLFIVDSLGIYPTYKPNVVLLTHSPKINLERFIIEMQPNLIIADGSNYKSVVARWKETCFQRKIPFHYTAKKGFYEFD